MLKALWIKFLRIFYRGRQELRLCILAATKKTVNQKPSLISFSHPRCATQSMGKILEAICGRARMNLYWGYVSPDEATLKSMLSKYHVIFLHRTMPGDFPDRFDGIDFRGFHMIRDPRNVLVSMFFSHGYSHKLDKYTSEIEKDREFLISHSVEEGLLYLMDHSKQFNEMADSLKDWDLSDPRLTTIRFEEYKKDVFGHWQMILKCLGMSVSKEALKRILSYYSFAELQKSSKERSGVSHYRSGSSDDYKQHFTPKVKDVFKEKYGNLLIHLGYER